MRHKEIPVYGSDDEASARRNEAYEKHVRKLDSFAKRSLTVGIISILILGLFAVTDSRHTEIPIIAPQVLIEQIANSFSGELSAQEILPEDMATIKEVINYASVSINKEELIIVTGDNMESDITMTTRPDGRVEINLHHKLFGLADDYGRVVEAAVLYAEKKGEINGYAPLLTKYYKSVATYAAEKMGHEKNIYERYEDFQSYGYDAVNVFGTLSAHGYSVDDPLTICLYLNGEAVYLNKNIEQMKKLGIPLDDETSNKLFSLREEIFSIWNGEVSVADNNIINDMAISNPALFSSKYTETLRDAVQDTYNIKPYNNSNRPISKYP